MKTIFMSLLLFVNSYQSRTANTKADLEAILDQVLNHTELLNFTEKYAEKGDTLYFRFGSSPVYTDQELASLKNIIIKTKKGFSLVYDIHYNEKQKPIIYIKILKLTQDNAQVRIGFDIEGAVGAFTLEKKDTWVITERDVYEI